MALLSAFRRVQRIAAIIHSIILGYRGINSAFRRTGGAVPPAHGQKLHIHNLLIW